MIVPVPYPIQKPRDLPRVLSSAEVISNRASSLYLANRTDEALDLARLAVRMERSVMTLNNLAVVLETFGQFDEAFPCAKEAYELEPANERMARLYGEALLRRGDLALGWQLYDESHPRLDWLSPTVPEWHGEPIANRRLLVFAFGGYGDNIYFMRWLADLRRFGVDVTYLCPPDLASLARTLGVRVVENWNGNFDLKGLTFDYHTMLHAIPRWLGVTFENYVWPGAYLRVRPRPWVHLRRRVGFCWQAGEVVSPRRTRSLNWEQRQRISEAIPRHVDLSGLRGSWLDTARIVASLDLLITVDTGVAHLGGALGVPTKVILPGASSWHYPTNRGYHPFYPSLEMFRNGGEGMDHAINLLLESL